VEPRQFQAAVTEYHWWQISIFNVDMASTLSHDFLCLPYTRLGRKMYLIDSDVMWDQ